MLLPHIFHGFDVAIQPQHVLFWRIFTVKVQKLPGRIDGVGLKCLHVLSPKVILKPKAWHTYLQFMIMMIEITNICAYESTGIHQKGAHYRQSTIYWWYGKSQRLRWGHPKYDVTWAYLRPMNPVDSAKQAKRLWTGDDKYFPTHPNASLDGILGMSWGSKYLLSFGVCMSRVR